MSNLMKLEFAALDITGKNYLSWVLDVEIHLDAKGLGNTIIKENKASKQDIAKAMIFLRHHLDEGFKTEYLTIKDPLKLWNNLKERYDHQKTVILPNARYDWMHLRLQDFKSVSKYNSAIFKISSQLKLCGENITDEDLLEKIFSTFHVSNVLLQQQYREKGFKKHSELISCLLVAEQNNELLMRNHEIRPTGFAPFPKVNVMLYNNFERGNKHGRNHGRSRGRGRNNYRFQGGHNSPYHRKWTDKDKQEKQKNAQNNISKATEDVCHRCGLKGHWLRTCRTPNHFVKLYQASIKGRGNNMETNFTYQYENDEANFAEKNNDVKANLAYKDDDFNGLSDITHLDATDFLE
ncbi:hypothetical protein CDL12_12991 [Handroanthus impetiginosus]|uniref:CCHC-type domain-containing protein n=1 Tax=Handroanthus impetiginosus TaxID=429701 RepID=A0A2G9HA29_9LAMI|nr:hypothetical protein CDL12_12991 [Handroanthus impetiginosus]